MDMNNLVISIAKLKLINIYFLDVKTTHAFC